MTARATTDPGAGALLTVERGLCVLRAFRSDLAPIGNAELVRRTGLSKATVSRLTSTLLQLGFLRHVAGGRKFELAVGPLGIGHAFVETSELLQLANPFLQALADRLDVSVALAVRDELDMVYIGYRASHRVATLRLGVGSVLPMGTTSIGRAYLWALSAAEQRRLIAQIRRRAGAAGAELERTIRQSFAELDSQGVCAILGGFQRDAFGIAVPVRVGRQRTLMSLSCGRADVRPSLATERKRIAPVLKAAAVEFEALLAEVDGEP